MPVVAGTSVGAVVNFTKFVAVPKVPVRLRVPPADGVERLAKVSAEVPVPALLIVLPPWSMSRAPAVSVELLATKSNVPPWSVTARAVRRLLVFVPLLFSLRVAPLATRFGPPLAFVVAVLLRTSVPLRTWMPPVPPWVPNGTWRVVVPVPNL